MLKVLLFCLCCSPYLYVESTKKILHFSDSHLNISDAEGVKYGQDSSLLLMESALQYAKQILAKPDLFLFTGDHVAHGRGFSQSYIAKSLAKNVQMMHSAFFNHSKHQIFTASLGNADCTPDYHMEVIDPHKMSANSSIQPLASPFKSELHSMERFALFQQTGFAIEKIDEKLHLISLNTIPYSIYHTPDTLDNSDPFNQFQWLDTQLQNISRMKEFAFIVGHIPPIINPHDEQGQWHEQYVLKYKGIIGKYTTVVRAQLFGHIHSIQFRLPVAHTKLSSLNTPLFTTGSISPIFGNNPSFTIWEYDAKSYELLDYSVYFTDLKHPPHSGKNKKIKMEKATVRIDVSFYFQNDLYVKSTPTDFHRAYSMKSLATTNFVQFLNRMKKNDKLFNDYFNHTNANSDKFKSCTDDHCVSKNICGQIWHSTRAEYLRCKSDIDFQRSAIKKSEVMMVFNEVGIIIGVSIATCGFVYLFALFVHVYFQSQVDAEVYISL